MRPLWKGAISFGLVNIPVSMYSASQDREIKFTLLHKKDLSEIRYARICKNEEKEVPYSEIVKGFSPDGKNYVVLTEEDFDKADQEKSKSIEILSFVDANEIDSVYYDKPYFLEPDKRATKAYALLMQALERSGKVGLAKFTMKNHERIAILKAYEGILILNQLRYQSEIHSTEAIVIPKEKIANKELEMAEALIEQRTEKFKPEKFKDTYTEDLKALIKKKTKGTPFKPVKAATQKPSKVTDIMSLLKESLAHPNGRQVTTRKTSPHKTQRAQRRKKSF